MLVDQYYAYDANENKIIALSRWDPKFEKRVTPIYWEREFYNTKAKRFDLEIIKVRD